VAGIDILPAGPTSLSMRILATSTRPYKLSLPLATEVEVRWVEPEPKLEPSRQGLTLVHFSALPELFLI